MHVDCYVKPGCHSCDEALDLLADAQALRGFSLQVHHIIEPEAWFDAYRYAVPVVVVDGREMLRLRVNAEGLALALDDDAARRDRE